MFGWRLGSAYYRHLMRKLTIIDELWYILFFSAAILSILSHKALVDLSDLAYNLNFTVQNF